MRSKVWIALFCGAWVVTTGSAKLDAARPTTVSPGSANRFVQVRGPCPSFSWGGVAGARSYELVVYEVGGVEGVEGGERPLGAEVLRQRIPGAALSWTPSLGRCLEPGGRYAWLVRAVGKKAARSWSEPALFEVSAEPSLAEVREALEVLRGYLAGRGGELGEEVEELVAAVEVGTGSEAALGSQREQLEVPGVPVPASLLPAPAAIWGQESTSTGTAFGLVGLSHSADGGYGVYGENSATGNYGYLGGHDYGVLGRGAMGGGYFKDENQ